MLQSPRGTHDLLPTECRHHRHITSVCRDTAETYGFAEIETPIFEFSSVFRHLGDTSDVVTKETYTFHDRSGDELTLRPEGTASVARMVIAEGLAQQAPLKYFYAGPMFRYDRPQKGRYRQFEQAGVELLGVSNPLGDIEVIALAARILKNLGVWEQVTLELNTLGDTESRAAYRSVLVEYLRDHYAALSPDSQHRLERNPLRILDSKEACDQLLIAQAPSYQDYLNNVSQDFFNEVCEGLKTLKIPYRLNPKLVRGLDYYCHTAFEFISQELGSQGTVLAGGRYDNLLAQMGGPTLPGVGWAAGIARLNLITQTKPSPPRPLVVIPIGDSPLVYNTSLQLIESLREAGYPVDMTYSGATAKRLKRANKLNAKVAILLGEDELVQGVATLRELDSGDQSQVSLENLSNNLIHYFNNPQVSS